MRPSALGPVIVLLALALIDGGAAAAAATPQSQSLWDAKGPHGSRFGWSVDVDPRFMLSPVGGVYKPDPGDRFAPEGWCGVGFGAAPPRVPIIHGAFSATELADAGYVSFIGLYTSRYTARGVYEFNYDCGTPGPGPIRQSWTARCIDKCTPPPPPPKYLPALPGRGSTRPLPPLPHRRGAGRAAAVRTQLCISAAGGRRLLVRRRGRVSAQPTLCGAARPLSSGELAELRRHGLLPAGPGARGDSPGAEFALPALTQCGGPPQFTPVLASRSTWCARSGLEVSHYLLTRHRRVRVGVGLIELKTALETQPASGRQLQELARLALSVATKDARGTLRAREVGLRARIRCTFLDEPCAVGQSQELVSTADATTIARLLAVRHRPQRLGTARIHLILELSPPGTDAALELDAPRIRCDGAGPRRQRRRTGCVLPGFTPTVALSAANPAANGFYRTVQAELDSAPGLPGGTPLRRARASEAGANRRRAQRRCAAELPARPAGSDCDEFPFAAARTLTEPFSVAWIPARENRSTGAQLSQRWATLRVLVGDRFWVHVPG